MTAPLAGIRVLELALQYPGPYCSTLLSGLGAEIIKIEHPGGGDAARRRPAFFNAINFNKCSVSLDLKQSGAREVLYRLAGQCDVVTEGFRPGVAQRLGIDYPTLRKINPRIVYCAITGFGQTGPYKDLPGHDLNYMALSGMLNYFQDDQGRAMMPGVAMADLSAGMFAVIGIMAGLLGRERSGQGCYVDVAMIDSLLSLMGTNLSMFAATGQTHKPRDAGYGLFQTSDGKLLALGIAHEDWFWDRLCRTLELEALVGISGPERTRRRPELMPVLQEVFAKKPLTQWLALLKAADVPATPAPEMADVLQDAHARERNMIRVVTDKDGRPSVRTGFPVKFSPPVAEDPGNRIPELGEHTEEILKSLGYNAAEIAQLRKAKAI